MSLPLNEDTVARLSPRVSVPTYERAALTPGVVHISVGSFHRSHQAVYFDELARRGLGDEWGLIGVGLRRREMKEILDAQDGLYTVVARDASGEEARVVGVIVRYLFAPEETAEVIAALADPRTRLVTLTVTQAGYDVDDGDAEGSALGLIVEALDRRRRAGAGPFTVLSCDNLPDNGRLARTAVLDHARRRDAHLARWIEERVTFPSSMVDRITPTTTDEDRARLARDFGVADGWPVVTEPFSQWVVEDRFCNGRPPLDAVGVEFVDDVRPYALAKTRLLNGTHSALGYLGSLAGYEHLDEVMADPGFAAYAESMMEDEMVPLLPGSPADLRAYAATLRERFANPAVADRLSRLCRNGSIKVPAHLLGSIRAARAAGRPHELLTLAVAGWCRYLQGVDADGRPLEVDDPAGERLQRLARAGDGDPAPLLADRETFGLLGRAEDFAAAVRRDVAELGEAGVGGVLAARVARGVALA